MDLPSPGRPSDRRSGPGDWRDPVRKDMGTRRYLMERASMTRPFMYDKSLVFSRVEANAVERVRRTLHEYSSLWDVGNGIGRRHMGPATWESA